MNTEEAIREIEGLARDFRDPVSRILAAGMIADATNRLADQKKRQMDMQETLMEKFSPVMDMYADMISKMTPAVDQAMQAMKDEMEERSEGESWKHGRKDDDKNED